MDTPEAKAYHEPDVIDDNIFFPMNWTFYLSCDRIRPQDCIFSPIQRAPPSDSDYSLRLRQVSSPFRSPEVGPSFDVLSIMPPHTQVNKCFGKVKLNWKTITQDVIDATISLASHSNIGSGYYSN